MALIKTLTNLPIIRFVNVGLIATGLHAVLYYLLVKVFHVSPQLANFSAFAVAFTFSYLGQRYYTFQHVRVESEHLTRLKFATSGLLSYSINAFWVYLVEDILIWPAEYALIGIAFITPVVTFVIFSLWVFKDKDTHYTSKENTETPRWE